MINKTEARTIIKDKWGRKKYLQEYDSDTIEDVIKIRLHVWQVTCNYKKDNTDTKYPFCKKSEDTTEHVLECEKAKKFLGRYPQEIQVKGRRDRKNYAGYGSEGLNGNFIQISSSFE